MSNIFKHMELDISIATVFLNTQILKIKGNLIKYKCLYSSKNFQHKLDKKLNKRIFNTYKFSNHNNNKFTLLL